MTSSAKKIGSNLSPFTEEDQIYNNYIDTKGKEDDEKKEGQNNPWKPKSKADLFRNSYNLHQIDKYIKNKNQNKNNEIKGILIRGNIGCGKITLITTCLKELGLKFKIHNHEVSNENFFKLKTSLNSSGLGLLFESLRLDAIIIKDFDNNLKTSQKQDLFKWIKENNHQTLLFFTSYDLSPSSSRGIPNCVQELIFEEPYLSHLISLGTKIIQHTDSELYNDTEYKYSQKAIGRVARECNNDIRHFENTILNQIGSQQIKTRRIKEFEMKNLNLGVKDTLNYIIDMEIGKRIRLNVLHMTSLHTNSVVQHNYIKMVKNEENNDSLLEMMNTIDKMNDWILMGQKMETYVRTTQGWNDSELYGIFGTLGPLTINQVQRVEEEIEYAPNYLHNLVDWSFPIFEQLTYSLRHIVNKNVKERSLYLNYLINHYDLDKSKLRILCKFSNLKPNFTIITSKINNYYAEIKFSKMKTLMDKELIKLNRN